MKVIILAALLVAAVSAASVEDAVQIVRNEFVRQPEGSYQVNLETSDGTKREEVGELKEVAGEDNKPQTVVVVRGSYEYKNDKGDLEKITYFADENGFHPEGPSIPKEPVV